MEIKNLKLVLHALTVLAVIGGIYKALGASMELRQLLMIKYLLWAILFEIIALNVKE